MLLLLRFGFIIFFFACIIAIPLFLIKLNELEKSKKVKQKENEKEKKQAQSKVLLHTEFDLNSEATPKVKTMFRAIENKLHDVQYEKKWLSLEANHYIDETFPNDFQSYQSLYNDINDKESVEKDVLYVLQSMFDELIGFEKEIEEKKKVALDRQGYIMENREKKHL